MTRRTWAWIIGLLSLLLLLIPVGYFAWYVSLVAGSDEGSPEVAAEWKLLLATYADPESAMKANAEVITHRCQNGEWIMGLAANSHGIWHRGNGTVVIRDSSGTTRAFFGHVCGGGYLGVRSTSPPSAEWFYKQLTEKRFEEHQFSED